MFCSYYVSCIHRVQCHGSSRENGSVRIIARITDLRHVTTEALNLCTMCPICRVAAGRYPRQGDEMIATLFKLGRRRAVHPSLCLPDIEFLNACHTLWIGSPPASDHICIHLASSASDSGWTAAIISYKDF